MGLPVRIRVCRTLHSLHLASGGLPMSFYDSGGYPNCDLFSGVKLVSSSN